MAKKRGRPVQMDRADVESIIEAYADEIFCNGKLVSKNSTVWQKMSDDSNGIKKARGFFSHLADNRDGIADRLLGNDNDTSSKQDCSPINDVSIKDDSTLLDSSGVSKTQSITINFTHREFDSLLEQKEYKRSEKDRPNQCIRQYTCFKSGEWQLAVTDKLWSKKISHGYNFKTHKISHMTHTGYFKGYCNCGSEIVGTFEDITSDNIVVTCEITSGKGLPCGKRYCRKPEREALGTSLLDKNKTVGVYRAEKAEIMMESNDPEPPHLYSANVLRQIKKEAKAIGRVHGDVLRALEILQLTTHKDVIHGLGVNPFLVHYWTHHQLDVWRNYSKVSEAASIFFDATGSIVRTIERPDKTKSKVIYLYEGVVNTGTGQFSVTQMITEAHNTNSIQFWFMEWLRSGAPYPREVVCDSSIALLAASVRAFTGYRTIDQYADACTETSVPCCYIRIDVAHFIKMYANLLKGVRPRIRKFYLASLGQLLLSANKTEARDRLTWLLTVARSETEGATDDGETLCEIRKRKLQCLLTGTVNTEIETCIDSIDNQNDDDRTALPNMQADAVEDNELELPNSWKVWGQRIDESVTDAVANEEGDRENAHFLPRLADRVVKDMKWFPLWSCVCRNTFGYGREPASSAPVESDFNDVKNRLLKNETLPMRADDFIPKHVKYLNGRIKLNDAAAVYKTADAKITIENSELDDSSDTQKNINDTLNCNLNHNNDSYDQFLDDKKIPIANSIVSKNEDSNRITIANIQEFGVGCVACASGNYPGGAHHCVFCKKPVHALPGCSESIEGQDEGYGQKRICVACKTHHQESITAVVTSNEVENWRGLATKKTKRSRYLRSNFLEHELLLHDKLLKVPILKSGDKMSLTAVKTNGSKITLTNTCPFDSTFQLFLTAALDSANLLNNCASTTSPFLNMVHKAAVKGLHSSTYSARAQILSKLGTVSKRECGVALVDCQMTVGGLCCKLFNNVPSLIEIVTCTQGCPERVVHLPRIQVDRKHASNAIDFVEAINLSMTLDDRVCGHSDCSSQKPPSVNIETGFFLIVELSNSGLVDNTKNVLEDIPVDLQPSFSQHQYHLVGVVEFKPPGMTRRMSDTTAIGHYVAISRRRDHSWVLYDDTKICEKILTAKYEALIEILLYEKIIG